MTIKVKKDNK